MNWSEFHLCPSQQTWPANCHRFAHNVLHFQCDVYLFVFISQFLIKIWLQCCSKEGWRVPRGCFLGTSPNVVFATWLQKPSANTIIIIYFGIITVSVNMQCVVFQRDTDTGCPLSVFILFCSFQAGAGKTYIWSMDHHHVFILALPSHFVLWRKIWKRMQGLWNWLYLIIML